MGEVRFHSWARLGAAAIHVNSPAGRPAVHLQLTASDGAGPDRSGTVRFALHGPGDVAGVLPGAIRSRYPRPGQADAEAAYCPYIEFVATDLPWRYSPRGIDGGQIRPWLALLVLTADEVTTRRRDRITVSAAALGQHPHTWATAHVQLEGDLSRVLCLRELASHTDYTAYLVPAFRADGVAAWDGTAPESLQVYDQWSFRTGEPGTFRSLAMRLRAADDLAGFGRIHVAVGTAAGEAVDVRGALTGIADTTDAPPPDAAVDRLEALLAGDEDPEGRRYVRPPRYGEAWRAGVVTSPPAGGWVAQVNTDPTHRVVAGIGVQAAIDLQEEIASGAGDRSGATAAANQRINGLVVGLTAARSLWDAHLPAEREGRLGLLGLAAGRILSEAGDGSIAPLLDRATGPSRTLPPALFSTAARRILRPGAARFRHAAADATRLIEVANEVRPTVRRPEDAPGDARHSAGVASGDTLVAHGTDLGQPCRLVDGQEVEQGDGVLVCLARANLDVEPQTSEALDVMVELIDEAAGRPVPRPADLSALDDALVEACNPHRAPVAQERVLGTITPSDPEPLAPREPCIDLDLPAWRYLRDRRPEWLLPGAETLEDGEVVGMASNPVFVDAFVVGWNTQALAELRWRNLRLASACTPLRHFWDSSVQDGPDYRCSADVVGIEEWARPPAAGAADPASVSLGDPAHRPAGVLGRQLVICIRSDLFRRYPSTLVYLAGPPPPAVPGPVDFQHPRLPSFVAQVSSSLVLFAFAVDPDELRTHWVVVEQQPPGFRFERALDTVGTGPSADRARRMLVPPVRVVLAGDSLVGGGA